jgi:hypothetical protein
MMAASTLSLVCSSITASLPDHSSASTQVAPRQLPNLRARSAFDQRVSMLRCNNSMVKSIVSIVPHLMMHKNNAGFSLIQELLLAISHVFMYY